MKLDKVKLFFFDLETTGLDIESSEILQVWGKYISKDKEKEINSFFRPENKFISIKTRVIHWISYEKVKDKEKFNDKNETYLKLKQIEDKAIWIAHNGLSYDFPIIEKYWFLPKLKVDTLKIARYLLEQNHYEDLEESFSLQHLKYYFIDKGYLKEDDFKNLEAHNALSDVLILEKVFYVLYDLFYEKYYNDKEKDSEETTKLILTQMINISNKPLLLHKFPFGKRKGEIIEEMSSNNIMWYLNNLKDLDNDLKYTLNYHIESRNWF